MNPITNMKNLNKMNDRELEMGLAGTKQSWHNEYRNSAWIFVGGLPYDLTEGDVICVFSQFGEIVHINLVRDMKTGKSKGFSFICYEDQRSTILAVDNLNGMKLLGRLVRVDHVHTYKLPKDLEKMDQDRRKLFEEGVAPKPIQEEVTESESESSDEDDRWKRKKATKKVKKKKRKKKKKRRGSSSSESSREDDEKKKDFDNSKVKRERRNPERQERSPLRIKKEPRSRSRDRSDVRVKRESRYDARSRSGDRSNVRVKREPRSPPDDQSRRSRRSRSRSGDRNRDRNQRRNR